MVQGPELVGAVEKVAETEEPVAGQKRENFDDGDELVRRTLRARRPWRWVGRHES